MQKRGRGSGGCCGKGGDRRVCGAGWGRGNTMRTGGKVFPRGRPGAALRGSSGWGNLRLPHRRQGGFRNPNREAFSGDSSSDILDGREEMIPHKVGGEEADGMDHKFRTVKTAAERLNPDLVRARLKPLSQLCRNGSPYRLSHESGCMGNGLDSQGGFPGFPGGRGGGICTKGVVL